MKTIAIAGTFDTKGQELSYIKEKIEAQGVRTLCINTGVGNCGRSRCGYG